MVDKIKKELEKKLNEKEIEDKDEYWIHFDEDLLHPTIPEYQENGFLDNEIGEFIKGKIDDNTSYETKINLKDKTFSIKFFKRF